MEGLGKGLRSLPRILPGGGSAWSHGIESPSRFLGFVSCFYFRGQKRLSWHDNLAVCVQNQIRLHLVTVLSLCAHSEASGVDSRSCARDTLTERPERNKEPPSYEYLPDRWACFIQLAHPDCSPLPSAGPGIEAP